MNWILLGFAGLMEIGWVYFLKLSESFTQLRYGAIAVVLLVASMAALALALRTIPIGTAYAIWTGIGAVGAGVLGIWLFGEVASPLRLGCIGLIVLGVTGLKLLS